MSETTPIEMDYPDHVDRLRRLDTVLADEVAGFTGISSVMAWMQRHGRTRAPIDIVGQDEFHYDFMIELEPAARWLVFGVT
jgi:hypothetical protein